MAIRVKVSAPQGLLFTSALTLIPQIECSGPIQGGILAKQPANSDSLQTTLLRAREIAEELGDAVVLYFIDMAILEARTTNPPTAINNKPRIHKESRVSPKKTKQIRQFRIWSTFIGLILSWLLRYFNVRHSRRELDNSGAQFWMLDTDKSTYKTSALFRRCVNLHCRTRRACIITVRIHVLWRNSESRCRIYCVESFGIHSFFSISTGAL